MRPAKKGGRFRALLRGMLLIVVVGLISTLLINLYVIRSAGKYIVPAEDIPGAPYGCALILGARVYASGSLSPMLEDRVLAGVELYRQGAVSWLLMSGDYSADRNYDEVGPMRDTAFSQGVPLKDIDTDPSGYSTYASMYRAKNVFAVDRMVVVTQDFHLYRAVYIARAMGIDAYGVAADRRDYKNQWYNCLRESLARVKDFFAVMIAE